MSAPLKYLTLFVLIIILFQLGRAFYHLVRKDGDRKELVKSLIIRVGMSISLFVVLIAATQFGFIKTNKVLPHTSVDVNQQQ